MYLPEKLQRKSFVEWNYLVNGLVAVWELASLLNVQEDLDFFLRCDHEARLAEMLGNMGNDSRVMDIILRYVLSANIAPERVGNLCTLRQQSETLSDILRDFYTQDPAMEPIIYEASAG